MKNGEENKYRSFRQIGLYTAIPIILAAGPVVGYLIGDYIDKKFGTAPWFMFIFLILGFIAGVRQTIFIITKASKNNQS